MTVVAHTIAEYAALSGRVSGQRAFVPTMGALHEGHIALIRAAREKVGPEGEVVVSIFVNPTQFTATEDLSKYPRPFNEDVHACTEAGVDVVFAPLAEEMYPGGVGLDSITNVEPGPVGQILEALDRPGHFAGMLTVVNKLFNITQPQYAVFGEKDYQQLALVSSMVRDLNMPVTVHGVATVRDSDGVALSSRNTYLSEAEREVARSIPVALTAAQTTVGTVAEKLEAAQAALSLEVSVMYLEAMTRDLSARLNPATVPDSGRILFAGVVGTTRLIDNCNINSGDTNSGETK